MSIWAFLCIWFLRRFLNDLTIFFQFIITSPSNRTEPFIWTIFKLLLHRDDLHQISMKLACWFWRRTLKKISVCLLFRYYLPLGKGVDLHMNNCESPSRKDDLCQHLVQQFWRRSRKCKNLQKDNERSEKLTWAFRSVELNCNISKCG
jgi:hypothetical protein